MPAMAMMILTALWTMQAANAQDEKPPGSSQNPQNGDFRAFWKEGLNFETADKHFRMKIGGRIHNDWVWVSHDDSITTAIGDQEDGTLFRRARLYASGDIYENFFFKAQFDFAGGDADFKDVYLGVKKLPTIGNVKIGQFKEPFSLEELTSSNYITFLERSLPNVFAPTRNTGGMVYNTAAEDRVTWAVGVFRDTDDFGNASVEGESAVTARVTGLPWYEDNGGQLVHVGLAGSLRGPNDDALRFRQRPEVGLSDRFVDTGNFEADRVTLIGVEGALVYGSFSLQTEYMIASVDSEPATDPSFSGFYVYASYFVTGEHRGYSKTEGAFSRTKPKENFGVKGGLGAIELTLRFSMLDLEDDPILGGELTDITAGVNWYLNPNFRVMLNYILADLDNVGDADILALRFQADF
ncbi:MAG: porin [Planctomycetes bacterium]|nr:porin [Planctomycetota bacterium]